MYITRSLPNSNVQYHTALKIEFKKFDIPFKEGNSIDALIAGCNADVVIMSNALQDICRQIHDALVQGVRAVAANYATDKRMEEILPIPKKIRKYIAGNESLGTMRPDLLFDANGKPRVIEINARFPMNGFYLSEILSSTHPDSRVFPISIRQLDDALAENNAYARLAIEEKGLEIYIAASRHTIAFPDAKAFLENASNVPVISELHEYEIESLSERALSTLANNSFNSLQSIFLVHDKRLLAILSDEDIMEDYLDATTVSMLKSYVTPTDILRQGTNLSGNSFILKPAKGGKSKDIYFSDDMNLDELVIIKDSKIPYVMQPCIQQKPFMVSFKGTVKNANLVGTLLSLDGQYLGPGLFRATTGRTLEHGNVDFAFLAGGCE